ncbi:hypothetical protein SEUCBS140593_003066 [Sporothrix eucalyptigena]|uniref:C6 zinc finger domain containing protein n=1 Tax=Sporothrix eucalyptigena TaxID=1812306 RepID=A0ABP0BBT6_9PEZI
MYTGPNHLPVFLDPGALHQGTLMTLITKNDMQYSMMVDDVSPNLISFALATIRELAGSDAQMERAYRIHQDQQTPLRPVIETDTPMESHFGQRDRIDEFRTYYARRLVVPTAPLRDNLVAELFQGDKAPLWMGLFACYGLPLVHLSDSMEVKAATYAKQALALAASNLDQDLCALFGAIASESRQRSALFGPSPMSSTAGSTTGSTTGSSSSRSSSRPPPLFVQAVLPQQNKKWTRDPLSILNDLSQDGRLSGLSLVLPGYVSHAQYGRPWSTQPVVAQIVLESVWQWDLAETVNPLDALEELGHVTVALACRTHKAGADEPPEFDFFLSFLPTLVLSLRMFLGGVRRQYPAVSEISLVLIRCLWAQIVLVYILQLRPKISAWPLPAAAVSREEGDFLLRDFYADTALSQPRHQDAFYLRALRTFAMLAAMDLEPQWTTRINDAAILFQTSWRRWVGRTSDEPATVAIRL